jgi:predicted benzoate:H+ symporter BenE
MQYFLNVLGSHLLMVLGIVLMVVTYFNIRFFGKNFPMFIVLLIGVVGVALFFFGLGWAQGIPHGT